MPILQPTPKGRGRRLGGLRAGPSAGEVADQRAMSTSSSTTWSAPHPRRGCEPSLLVLAGGRRPARGLVIGVEVVQPAGFGTRSSDAGRLSADLFRSPKIFPRGGRPAHPAQAVIPAHRRKAHGAQSNCKVGVRHLARRLAPLVRRNELELNRPTLRGAPQHEAAEVHAGVNRVLGLTSVEPRFVSRSSTPVRLPLSRLPG
jgi:hypothetical protein